MRTDSEEYVEQRGTEFRSVEEYLNGRIGIREQHAGDASRNAGTQGLKKVELRKHTT